MEIVELNSVNYGSTGKIMLQIAELARSRGHCVTTCCSKDHLNLKKHVDNQLLIGVISNSRYLHNLVGRVTGLKGCFSILDTLIFCRRLGKLKPDLIHLHNLHDSYINLPLLFSYIKKHHIPVVWTLHDCWAITGQCPHFTMAKCDKWKTGCHDCPQIHVYPSTMIDRTKTMWQLKKKWFTGVENLTIVTPSQWLADLVKQSFLKNYPVKVIHNGIDLSIFKPTPSDFRKKHGISLGQKLLLGVAFGWGKRKGLDVFIELAQRLDSSYQIVLVGTDDATDCILPENIISIHRTQNQQELAQIYTAANVFVNPTREDNYPTVNMEALACGTPVITFATGGSPESIDDTCGSVVPVDDIDALEREIIEVTRGQLFSAEACLARAKCFDKDQCFAKYISLLTGE